MFCLSKIPLKATTQSKTFFQVKCSDINIRNIRERERERRRRGREGGEERDRDRDRDHDRDKAAMKTGKGTKTGIR